MSVEKMEQYKEYKKHRKEILRKQKRKAKLQSVIGIGATVVILAAIIVSIYLDVRPKYEKDYRTLINWKQYVPQDVLGNDEDEADDSADAAKDTDKDADAKTEDNADTSDQE